MQTMTKKWVRSKKAKAKEEIPLPTLYSVTVHAKTNCAWCLRPFYPGETAGRAAGRTFCDMVHLRLWVTRRDPPKRRKQR